MPKQHNTVVFVLKNNTTRFALLYQGQLSLFSLAHIKRLISTSGPEDVSTASHLDYFFLLNLEGNSFTLSTCVQLCTLTALVSSNASAAFSLAAGLILLSVYLNTSSQYRHDAPTGEDPSALQGDTNTRSKAAGEAKPGQQGCATEGRRVNSVRLC